MTILLSYNADRLAMNSVEMTLSSNSAFTVDQHVASQNSTGTRIQSTCFILSNNSLLIYYQHDVVMQATARWPPFEDCSSMRPSPRLTAHYPPLFMYTLVTSNWAVKLGHLEKSPSLKAFCTENCLGNMSWPQLFYILHVSSCSGYLSALALLKKKR